MIKKDYYVYMLCYPSGKPFYVGLGHNNRIYQHEKVLNNKKESNRHKLNIIKKILKEGLEVKKVFLEKNLTKEESGIIEQKWIKFYGRVDQKTGILCNLTDGGEGTWNPTEEHRQKLIQSNKTRIISDSTKQKIGNTLRGRPLSEECKRKISVAMKKHSNTPECKALISKRFKGVKKPEGHGANVSKALRGKKRKPLSLERRMKISLFMQGHKYSLGRKPSEETKKKQSERMKGVSNPFYGKKHSEETKKQMSLIKRQRKYQNCLKFFTKTNEGSIIEKGN